MLEIDCGVASVRTTRYVTNCGNLEDTSVQGGEETLETPLWCLVTAMNECREPFFENELSYPPFLEM